jgi:hypothetical protein
MTATDRTQQRNEVAAYLRRFPNQSNADVAKRFGVKRTAVASIRAAVLPAAVPARTADSPSRWTRFRASLNAPPEPVTWDGIRTSLRVWTMALMVPFLILTWVYIGMSWPAGTSGTLSLILLWVILFGVPGRSQR